MKNKTLLAVDFGASSGRVMACHFNGTTIEPEIIHRFPNNVAAIHGGLFWNYVSLYEEMVAGIRKAQALHGAAIAGVGVDTWGVDYALLDNTGMPIGIPFSYRHPRTNGMIEAVDAILPKAAHYAQTGIQPFFFNTVYQLYAHLKTAPAQLAAAERLLFMPDLFNYLLSGERVNERTITSTSGLYNPVSGDWAGGVIDALGLPRKIFGNIVSPGTRLGTVRADTGITAPIPVIAVGGHDTAGAVAALPSPAKGAAFLSSGTWSLIGMEMDSPILTPDALADNFTNEIGVGGKIRFLKNCTGLWLVQECKRHWEKEDGKQIEFSQITNWCSEAPVMKNRIQVDDPVFIAPGNMPERIVSWCRQNGQPVPESRGAIIRTIYESLAWNYRTVLEKLARYAGHKIETLHIVGGGCRDNLLNQFTADITGCRVIAGPEEGTAMGNAIMQLIALGEIKDVTEGRRIISNSVTTRTYEPKTVKA